MAEGKLQPADSSEDVPLPATKAPDFDLSDESLPGDDTDESTVEQPETGAQGEPEGIFALFDREFDDGERKPIEPAESSEFDAEFSESFENMFTAVKGDGSAPLFETGEDIPPVESDLENAEGSMPPLPRLAPEPEPQPRSTEVSPEAMEDFSLDDEPLEFTPSAPTPDAVRPVPVVSQPRGIPFGSAEDDDDEDGPISLDEPDEIFFDIAPEPPAASAAAPNSELEGWGLEEEGLEELNFDDSEDEEIYDRDLSGLMADEDSEEESSEDFDDFAKMALGFDDEDDDEEEIDEEDDFVVEDLTKAKELDPFEEISIMSSEDVAKYEPSFGTDELKFQEEDPLPEDDADPFAMEGENSGEDDEELPDDLDPFGDGTATSASGSKGKTRDDPELAADDSEDDDSKSSDDESGDGKRAEKKEGRRPRSGSGLKAGGAIAGLLSVPWKLFSTLTGILFGVLESVIGLLGKLPLIGLPFRLLSSVLSAVPMALKRLIVLLLIVVFFWGGSALVGSFLPKPSTEVSLPDLGGASFSSVELKDGLITGEIENTGEINLFLFPEVQVSERKVLQPGSWFSPIDLGTCRGPLTEVAVDTTVKVSFSCDVATDSSSSLKPALAE